MILVFKRYIKKHGKKLGPYYYHNVRGNNGKVRTIYVGTNPNDHPKHKIRKPLFFLILVLILILILGGSLFFLQNKAVLLKESQKAEPNFDVDQILLKVLVKSGDYLEKQIRVMNTGNAPAAINLEISGVPDIVIADSNYFSLNPGQTKTVTLNFSSVVPNQKIEQQPGIYVGKLVLKSEKAAREVPAVVEIETKDVLFDMNLNPVAIERRVKQGEDTTIEVKVFNLESIESVNVDVEYFVKDMNGNTIVTESETVVVKTQASFFKTISIPKNLNPGTYVFAAKATFGSSVGTSSYMFEVTGPESQPESFTTFCKSSILCLGLSMTTMLLIFAVIAYLYFYVGSYLYEKLAGTVTLRRKKRAREETAAGEEVPAENTEQNAFSRIVVGIKKWREEREKEKLKKETAESGRALQNIQQEKEIERQSIGEAKQQQILKRQKEIEDKIARQGSIKREKEAGEQKALEDKEKAEEKKKAQLERKRLIGQRKNDIQNFFHKIGFYKTPEEKGQITLQKEKENQERLKRDAEAREQKELEKKRIEQDRIRKEEESKRLKEELEQKEEIEKKEAERKQIEEERKRKEEENDRRLEEERRKQAEERKKEEIIKQKELDESRKKIEIIRREGDELKRKEEEVRKKEEEKKKDEEIRKQKFELIKQFELKLAKNKESAQKLTDELNSLESEKRITLNKLNEVELQIQDVHHEIEEKSALLDKFLHQKGALIQSHQVEIESRYKKQKELEQQHDQKAVKMGQELAEKETRMMSEMQQELSKMSPDKREAAEHWKKLEIKAKLKLEEQKTQTGLKGSDKSKNYRQKEEEGYKEKLQEMNNNEHNLRMVIAGLKNQINALRTEKKDSPDSMADRENRIQIIRKKLEILDKEREQIRNEIAMANSGLSKISLDYLKNIFFTILDKREKSRDRKDKEKAISDDEKRKMEAELQKQKDLSERLRKIDEERKRKEEEKRIKGEKRRAEKEEKLRLTEEKKRQRETERQRAPYLSNSKKQIKEESPEAGIKESITKNLAGKSRNFGKCLSLLESARKNLITNKSAAKEMYTRAREIYIGLDYNEKKEIYNELMSLYNELLK